MPKSDPVIPPGVEPGRSSSGDGGRVAKRIETSRLPRPGKPTTLHREVLVFGMRMERRLVAPTNASPGYRLHSETRPRNERGVMAPLFEAMRKEKRPDDLVAELLEQVSGIDK